MNRSFPQPSGGAADGPCPPNLLARRPRPLDPKVPEVERQKHQQLSQESRPAHKCGPCSETLAEQPTCNMGRMDLPPRPHLSIGERKRAKEKQGCGTQVIVTGPWAPMTINMLGKLQSHCRTTNLDAKPFLPAPEGKNHSKQEGEINS